MKKKTKLKFTNCPRCGERHIDDPWYEHKCEGRQGLMAFIDQATKPEQTTCTTASALTHQNMRDAYQYLMYGRPGGMQTEIVRSREHEERRLMEREIARRSESYEDYQRNMRRYEQETERRRRELEEMYRRQLPNPVWRSRIFRDTTAGLSPDAADARDYNQIFYDEATSKLQTV